MSDSRDGLLHRWTMPLLVGVVLAVLLACPLRHAVIDRPEGADGGVTGGAGGVGVEIGDGGLSMGRPGIAMFMGGPRHRGRSPYVGPAERPTIRWRFRTGARVFASPTIGSNGTIYIGSVDGTFNALNPEGHLLWSYAASGSIFSSAAVSSAGHIYVGCDDGTFLAFHPSGRVLWSDRREHPFDSSPVIGDDGTVYVGADGLHAYTPRGGRRWRARTGGHVFAPPVVHPRQLVVFGTQSGDILAFHDTGRTAFRTHLEGSVLGGVTVLETGAMIGVTTAGDVVALDRDGTQRWRIQLQDTAVRSTPAVGLDGNIYIGADNGRLYALDSENGQERWQFQTGGPLRASPIVDTSGRIYIGSQDHHVYSLDADGSIQWQLRLGGEIDSTGTIGPDGTYYTGSDDGNVYALR